MKKFCKITYLCIAILLSCFCFVGCSSKQLTVSFVRYGIGQRQNDYYLDFTLKFDNQTNNDIAINITDFIVQVNEEEFTTVGLLYEFEEVFYASATVESKQELNVRIRVVTNIKTKDYNYMSIKYNNELIIEDTLYISDNNLNKKN